MRSALRTDSLFRWNRCITSSLWLKAEIIQETTLSPSVRPATAVSMHSAVTAGTIKKTILNENGQYIWRSGQELNLLGTCNSFITLQI